jgi:VWFA-related protein
MFRSIIAASGVLLVFLSAGTLAQQTPAGQAPVFKASVDLVHLDVSVLDKNRQPVRGLTEKDFTVVEDGNPQAIVAFSAVDVPANPPKPAAWSYRVAADVQSNEGVEDPEGRLFVVLLDDAMIPMHTQSLATAREVARKFVERVTPADRVAVVFSASGRNQEFTGDRGRLVAAIDSLKSGHASHLLGWDTAKDPSIPLPTDFIAPDIPGPMGDPDIMYRNASMNTLRMVAETLISAPQRRKALLFISPGIVVDTVSAAMPMLNGPTVKMAMKDANQQLMRDMPELFNRMRRANVTIYPVDPCGNGGFQGYVMSAAANLSSLRVGITESVPGVPDNPALLKPMATATGVDWLNPGYSVPRADQLAEHVSGLSMDFLMAAAANTGGKAVVNTNDYDDGINRIFEENSSYYLIGYQQPAGQASGSQHRLTVKVNRPDVFVRARSGYDTPAAPKAPKAGKPVVPLSSLDAAIMGAVPKGAFPMRVAFAPFVEPGKKVPLVTVVLGLEQPPVTQRTNYTVDLQTNAYTIEGKPVLVGQRHLANVVLVPTKGKDRARYDLLSSISLPPGRYSLRISATRSVDGVTGSLYADVEVPDFTAPLAASGIVVEALPGGATAPMGAFDQFLPVVPTSNREFKQLQEVTAFMRLYQGGKGSAMPVTVKTRVVNEFDAQVGEGKDLVYGNEFRVGGRAADYRFAVPVAKLPPGLYLLTFEISIASEKPITRSVQFRVVQ